MSISTRGGASPARSRRVASSPSITGIRMSIRTTSGRVRLLGVDGLRAVAGLGDDADLRVGLEDHPEAGADERLVVGDQDADGHAGTPASSGRRARQGEAARASARVRSSPS